MIRKSVSVAIAPVLRNMMRNSIAMESLPDTPIDHLTDMVDPKSAEVVELIYGKDSPVEAEATIEAVSIMAEDSVPHAIAVEDIVTRGASIFNVAISVTQEEVIPAIGLLVDNIKTDIDKHMHPKVSIDAVQISPLITSSTIANAIAHYRGSDMNFTLAEATIKFGKELTEQDVVSRLETGSPELNQYIANLIAEKPENWVVSAIMNVCGGFDGEGYDNPARGVDSEHRPLVYPKIESMDAAIIGFLFCCNAEEDIPEGIKMSATDFEMALTNIKIAIAKAYNFVVDQLVQAVTNNNILVPQLITKNPTTSTNVKVIASQYEKLLSANGTNEAVLGQIVSDTNPTLFTLKNLIENKDALTAEWERYVKAYTINRKADISDHIKGIIVAHADRIAKEANAKGHVNVDREALREDVLELLGDGNVQPDTVYPLVVKIVAGRIYGSYKSNHIIYHIEKRLAEAPDMPVRTAAYLALVDLVVDWTLSQVEH